MPPGARKLSPYLHLIPFSLCLAALWAVLLASCSGPVPTATSAPDTPLPLPGPTLTLTPTLTPTPSPTPVPLAASVNGEGITLEDYELEVARYELAQVSLGMDPAAQGNYHLTVLEILIQQKVIEQGALSAGFNVSDAEVQAEIDEVTQAANGEEAFADWRAANLYTAEQFRAALKSQMLGARITEQIAGQAPASAEQVHARHILVAGESEAQTLLTQLQNGDDFATLALANTLDLSTRAAGGDLGWFPRGLLTAPEVEEAAFNLQPEEISGVIHSALGYHIVQTLEREPDRALSPDARLLYQTRTVEAWIQEQMELAIIERIVIP